MSDGQLFEAFLWRLGETLWLFGVVAAHTAWDASSAQIFICEFIELCEAYARGREVQLGHVVPFAEVAIEQQRRGLSAAVEPWRRRVSKSSDHRVFPRLAAAADSSALEIATVEMPPLSPEVRRRLTQCSREQGVPSAAGPLAALALTLAAASKQLDHRVAVVYANRDRPEHRSLLGFLAEEMPICLELSGATTLLDALRAVGNSVKEFRAAGLTLSAVFPASREEGPWWGEPVSDVLFNYIARSDSEADHPGSGKLSAQFCGHSVALVTDVRRMYDFTLLDFELAGRRDGGLRGAINYHSGVIEPPVAGAVAKALNQAMQAVALWPHKPVAALITRLERRHPQLLALG